MSKLEDLMSKVLEALPPRAENCRQTETDVRAGDRHGRGTPTSQPRVDITSVDPTGTYGQLDLPDYCDSDLEELESGQIDGREVLPDSDFHDEMSIPPIAAKFALSTDIGEPVDDGIAESTTYLLIATS